MNGTCSRRRALTAMAATAALLVVPGSPRAEEIAVPVDLQAALLVKVAGYCRTVAARGGDRVRVLVIVRRGDAASARTAAQLVQALSGKPDIAGLPHEESTTEAGDGAAAAAAIKARRATIAYLSSGFSAEDAEKPELR